MELAIQKLVIICFAVIGLSHAVQPRAWARFFMDLHGRGVTGSFLNAMMTLMMGVIIVSFHNVRTGIPVVLTVIGWLYVLKAGIYLTFPQVGVKAIGRVTEEKAKMFVVAGVIMMGVSGLLLYHVLTAPGG